MIDCYLCVVTVSFIGGVSKTTKDSIHGFLHRIEIRKNHNMWNDFHKWWYTVVLVSGFFLRCCSLFLNGTSNQFCGPLSER